MASPAIFATIGDALPKERRAMGFTFQSMLKRIPMVISPIIGGAIIAAFGLRAGIKTVLAILVYIPSAKIADRFGRKPFVIATFVCFALFPVTVALAHNFAGLAGAFVIGGLRESGEPSRKAMVVDFADPRTRARTVGLYYLVRSFSITPASAIGGLLWRIRPQIPFFTAGVIGIIGTLLFAATVEEKYAG